MEKGYLLACVPDSTPFEKVKNSIRDYLRPTLSRVGLMVPASSDDSSPFKYIHHAPPKKSGDLGWDDFGTPDPAHVRLVWQCSQLEFDLRQYFEMVDGRGIWVNGFIDPVIHSYKTHSDGVVISEPTLEYLRTVLADPSYPSATQLRKEQNKLLLEKMVKDPMECWGSNAPADCNPGEEVLKMRYNL